MPLDEVEARVAAFLRDRLACGVLPRPVVHVDRERSDVRAGRIALTVELPPGLFLHVPESLRPEEE